MGKFINLSGKRFGSWMVLNRGPNSEKGNRVRYYCKCDCGTISLIVSCNLSSGKSTGCGKCQMKRRECYHGMSGSKTYSAYVQMVERCHNETHKFYSYYGGRGISVCSRWRDSFKNFLSDMGEAPPNLSLDRTDNNKGYSKDNCRWVSKKEQQRNRRNSIHLGDIYNGWIVLERFYKTGVRELFYKIKCRHCSVTKEVRSCNLRTRHPCKCQKELIK